MNYGRLNSYQLCWRATPILLVAIGIQLLASCRFWEKPAPQRSFTPADLLISPETIQPAWEATDPFFPAGKDLCTTECAAIQLISTKEGTQDIVAGHEVFRYLSSGIAQRQFQVVYLPMTRHLDLVIDWSYQSPVAEQWHIACGNMAGNAGEVCWWGGLYEEYIVVFRSQMVPDEMSLSDMENVIRAIDTRMTEYLEMP